MWLPVVFDDALRFSRFSSVPRRAVWLNFIWFDASSFRAFDRSARHAEFCTSCKNSARKGLRFCCGFRVYRCVTAMRTTVRSCCRCTPLPRLLRMLRGACVHLDFGRPVVCDSCVMVDCLRGRAPALLMALLSVATAAIVPGVPDGVSRCYDPLATVRRLSSVVDLSSIAARRRLDLDRRLRYYVFTSIAMRRHGAIILCLVA